VTAWRELETRGFTVVRDALSTEICATLAADFERGAPPEKYPHGFKLVGRAALAAAWTAIEPLVAKVRAATALRVDVLNFLTLSHYITTSLVERTSHLHQDFDLDYKLTGDHHHYLNFWIPITKPDPDRSNVCVVPFDALPQDAYALLVGGGGRRFVTANGETRMFGNYGAVLDDAARAPEHVFSFDLEKLVETPSLAAGDALVMRGDMIHRTQDASTARIAASIRVTWSGKVLDRAKVVPAPGDPAANLYATIERCVTALDRDRVTIGELVAFARGDRVS
jgi:hypothetical protein